MSHILQCFNPKSNSRQSSGIVRKICKQEFPQIIRLSLGTFTWPFNLSRSLALIAFSLLYYNCALWYKNVLFSGAWKHALDLPSQASQESPPQDGALQVINNFSVCSKCIGFAIKYNLVYLNQASERIIVGYIPCFLVIFLTAFLLKTELVY